MHFVRNNKLKTGLAGTLSALALSMLIMNPAHTVYAENMEESTATETESQLMEETALPSGGSSDEILIHSDMDTESPEELASLIDEEQGNVTYLNNMIEELSAWDPEEVSRDQIVTLHDLYEELSMAGKAQVVNYELVESFIASLHLEFTTEASEENPLETDSGKILDNQYAFLVQNESMSISVYYVTDGDGDGNPDEPIITIVAPSGEKTQLQHGMKTVENNDISMTLTWRDNFMQMDIDSAKNGLWRVETSADAVINLFDYAGSKTGEFSPEEPSSSATEGSTQDDSEKKGSGIKGALPLILFVILTPALLIGLKIFLSKRSGTSGAKKNSSRKKKKKDDDWEDEDYDQDDDEQDDAEMQAMARFLKSQQVSSEYDEEAADDSDVREREEMKKKAIEEAEEAGLEEFTEYPSGMVEENDDDDDGFGSRV